MLLFVVLLSFFYLKQYGKGTSYIEVTRFTSVSNRQNLMHCRVESPFKNLPGKKFTMITDIHFSKKNVSEANFPLFLPGKFVIISLFFILQCEGFCIKFCHGFFCGNVLLGFTQIVELLKETRHFGRKMMIWIVLLSLASQKVFISW